jgi:hypothetical protein
LAEPARPTDSTIPGMSVRASEPYCRNCDSVVHVKRKAMTYAFKLLIQELMSMNMGVRLKHTGDFIEEKSVTGLDYGLEEDDADIEVLELANEKEYFDYDAEDFPPESEWEEQQEEQEEEEEEEEEEEDE